MRRMWKTGMILGGIAAVSVLALAGCGKETPESLLKEMAKNQKKVKSFSGDLDLEMALGTSQMGMTLEMEMGMDMEFEVTDDPSAYHISGTMDIGDTGLSSDVEVYGKEKKDGSKMMVYTKTEGEWTKEEVDQEEENEMLEGIMDLEDFDFANDKLMMAKEMKEVNGKEAYELKTAMSGDELDWIMDFVGSESLDMDMSDTEAEVYIRIYKDSKLPASISMEIKEGEKPGDEEAYLQGMTFAMTYKEYDKVGEIKVPKEALDGNEATDDTDDILDDLVDDDGDDLSDEREVRKDKDGNYILTDYMNKKEVTVKTPKGYEAEEDFSSDTLLIFGYEPDLEDVGSAEESWITLSYTLDELDEYYTEEDLIASVKEDAERYQKDELYSEVEYTDVQEMEVDGKTVKYTSVKNRINDSYQREYQAWYITEEGFAVVCDLTEDRYGDSDFEVGEEELKELIKAVKE